MSHFDTAVVTVLKHEGYYGNDPRDTENSMGYGVSLRGLYNCPGINAKDFPISHCHREMDSQAIQTRLRKIAIRLYRWYWWRPFQYENIHDQALATKVFDLAVNMTSQPAHRCLQRAVRAAKGDCLVEDGLLGSLSFAAINAVDPSRLLMAYQREAAEFYYSLQQPRYLKGWLKRVYT